VKAKKLKSLPLFFILLLFGLSGCKPADESTQLVTKITDPFPSTYKPVTQESFVIEHATVLTGTGKQLDDASVLVEEGVIKLVGKNFYVPADVKRYNADGKWLTPGLIDVHSHLGVYPSPAI